MNLLFALLLPVLSHADLRFTYEPVEGEGPTSCVHKQIRDLPDYDVKCGAKRFTAHVIVRGGPVQNDTSLEILYWVTEPGDTETSPRKYHSTSALLHLKGKAELANLSLSQGVEDDSASLVLGWKAP